MPGFDALSLRTEGVSRSISAENFTGAKGAGGRATEGTGARAASRLGRGWKISPSIDIAPGATAELADIEGPGTLRHVWCTTAPHAAWRASLLRIHWEDEEEPAVEVPLGDFFCHGWNRFAQVSSAMVAANPNGGFNCYWPMPFRRRARITLENLSAEQITLYYQVDHELGPVAEESSYLHAHWRRSNPVSAGSDHTLLDGVRGAGHYVGTYLAWGVNSPGWWGEGELKFFLDGDTEFPTICGTGTEDYFGGAWNFDVPGTGYTAYTTPYLGLPQIIGPDGLYASQQRFGMYRWHVPDPVRFATDLRVTVQSLGIGPGQGNGLPHRYRPTHDDIASTAFFYLDAPRTEGRPPTPGLLDLEVD
ncbi:glycoside hydrolase family 172 protein [Streptomyces sp. SID5785]|uniref:glycoside hydrolase family 172 protein n=1 Tax=Streptomyces sp. SID5785 TaxID=2690309 RepID=UPI0019269A45|nr:glycoside hydrolase family 172 protein [Streptomyces sp. SID5785]